MLIVTLTDNSVVRHSGDSMIRALGVLLTHHPENSIRRVDVVFKGIIIELPDSRKGVK